MTIKNTLENIANKVLNTKIGRWTRLTLAGVTLMYNIANAQNNVDVHVQSVPSLKDTVAKVVFTNLSSGEKYWGKTTPDGKISLDIPNGDYEMLVEGKNDFRIRGTRTIDQDKTIEVQPMEKRIMDSPYYPSSLAFFEDMTVTNKYASIRKLFNTNPIPLRLFNDTTDMPSFMTGIQDSIIDMLERKTNGATRFRKADTDSAGIRTKYVPSSGMPAGYEGALGTVGFNNGNDTGYTDVTIYINTDDVHDRAVANHVLRRENARMKMKYAGSNDPNHIIRGNTVSGPVLLDYSNDEYWLFETADKIRSLTDISEYIDSVVTDLTLDLPSKPRTVVPPDGASNVDTAAVIAWRELKYQDVDKYSFELVNDTISLTGLVQDTSVIDTSKTIDGLAHSKDYFWRVKAHNPKGWGTYTQWNKFTTNGSSDVKELDIIAREFKIDQNYPNPFNPETTIRFQVLKDGVVSLNIYDIQGKLVEQLVNQKLRSGTYESHFNGKNNSSGTYFYRITAGKYVDTKKMVLTK